MPQTPHSATARPALIASDLDGTFLSPDGTVSSENAAALVAAEQAGIPVLFATGRPVRWLDVIRDLPGAHPTVIASNGAALYDLGTDRLLDRICLPPAAALTAVERIRRAVPEAHFAFESGTRFGYEPGYRTWGDDTGDDPALVTAPATVLAHDTGSVKMLVQCLSVEADELAARVQRALNGILTVTHSAQAGLGLVELSAPGVSKVGMLRRTCARLGIGADRVAAFGDMPNDVEMLSWAGLPRVVANAHPSVLALGFPVVPTNAESGVGRTIAGWLSEARAAAKAQPLASS